MTPETTTPDPLAEELRKVSLELHRLASGLNHDLDGEERICDYAAARLDSQSARIAELEGALRDLRDACTIAYKAGRIEPEPFVRAGNVLARKDGGLYAAAFYVVVGRWPESTPAPEGAPKP